MIRINNPLGNIISLEAPAQRIISLVPSQTELLFDIGAGNQLIGLTRFCIHPAESVKTKRKVGGTKTVNLQAVRELQPDLIIANKEENVKEQIETLKKEFPVFVTDVVNINDALQMIHDLGSLCGKNEQAQKIAQNIATGIKDLETELAGLQILTVIYLIWEKPMMAVGGENFIHEMLGKAGLQNLLGGRMKDNKTDRYPETSVEEIQQLAPDLLLLSSEPFPFSEKHIEKYKALLPGIRIEQVDGEMFSWYGSSMLKAIPYLRKKHSFWHPKRVL